MRPGGSADPVEGPCGLDTDEVRSWREAIAEAALGETCASIGADASLGLMAELERLRSAAAALQARLAVLIDDERRQEEARAEVPAGRRGAGVATEIGLARQMSVHRAQRMLGLAKALVREMPHTRAALAAGRIDEWRATLLVRETACLQIEDRADLDEQLCADAGTLAGLGDREAVAEARRRAYEIDARSVTRRAARARADRCVTLRPAPDTMSYLTALLPVAEGVAAYAALTKAADAGRAVGDERGRGQVMADTLVERITGQPRADDVPLRINLVMSAEALLGGSEEPAFVPGYGVVPAGWARDLVAGDRPVGGRGTGGRSTIDPAMNGGSPGGTSVGDRAVDRRLPSGPAATGRTADDHASRARSTEVRFGGDGTARISAPDHVTDDIIPVTGLPLDEAAERTGESRPHGDTTPVGGDSSSSLPSRPSPELLRWIRRLYRAPDTGRLVAMESPARKAPPGLAEFIRLRDAGSCRMPWCDAPGRHEDHVVRFQDGGTTSADNLQLLCETHNYAKEAPGWAMWTEATSSGRASLQRAPGLEVDPLAISDRGAPDLGIAEPGAADLGVAGPGAAEPCTNDPFTADAGAADPSVADPADAAPDVCVRTPAGHEYRSAPPGSAGAAASGPAPGPGPVSAAAGPTEQEDQEDGAARRRHADADAARNGPAAA